MPFTLCHPAIVLPLHRYGRRITSLPALVIGSMSPDFTYFFPLGVSGTFTHSLPGVLLYCVPAGLAAYLLYHAVVREPLLAWLPRAIGTRVGAPVHWPLQNARSLVCVAGSLAIGAASHIAWDAFTHRNTVIVNSYEIFRMPVLLGAVELPLFKVLQYLSSLVGAAVIAGCVAHWFKRTAPAEDVAGSLTAAQKWKAFAGVALAGIAGSAAGLVFLPASSIEHGLFNVLVTSMAAAALAIVCLCLSWQLSVRSKVADMP